jgi:hypothetical protein
MCGVDRLVPGVHESFSFKGIRGDGWADPRPSCSSLISALCDPHPEERSVRSASRRTVSNVISIVSDEVCNLLMMKAHHNRELIEIDNATDDSILF